DDVLVLPVRLDLPEPGARLADEDRLVARAQLDADPAAALPVDREADAALAGLDLERPRLPPAQRADRRVVDLHLVRAEEVAERAAEPRDRDPGGRAQLTPAGFGRPSIACSARSISVSSSSTSTCLPSRYPSYAAMSKWPWPERLKRIVRSTPSS